MMRRSLHGVLICIVIWASLAFLASDSLLAQNGSNERTFPQSKAAIERAIKSMQGNMAGRLPVLDGFAQPADGRSLARYARGYYQSTVDVESGANGSRVRITTKITAWYDDPAAAHSGYQLLKSNGRLEADMLDQLEEQLAKGSAAAAKGESVTASKAAPAPPARATSEATISAPEPELPASDQTFSSSLKHGLASARGSKTESDPSKGSSALQTDIDSLQDVLKNTAHPKNLVAVKKSGTPVVSKPSLTGKPEFLASQHDEFELLDFNADWVHVRISGLSRGWIWRNSVEMPEGIPDTANRAAPALAPAADLFHVIREEVAPFPGDWGPLRSKNVKIISVQKVDESSKDAGPQQRLEYTKFLLEKSFKEIAEKPGDMEGIVVIFDSADGGMIAVTASVLQEWKAGKLTDAALWHECFFDPPETFDSPASSGSKSGAAGER